jgi:hypothetical protein
MSHLVELAGGWSLWRWICVRGTGFPIQMLSTLALAESVPAIDRWLDAEPVAAEARRAAIEACSQALADFPDERKPISKLLKQLRAGQPVEPIAACEPLSRTLERLVAAEAQLAQQRRAAEELFAGEQLRVAKSLSHLVQDPRFREAVTWQNRNVLPGIDSLLRVTDNPSSKHRKNERLAASYLQRYCAKNDTIGFFGPVGWGSLGDPPLLRPGASLLRDRIVYFEQWAISALADRLAEDFEIRVALAPRRMPGMRLDGATLTHGVGKRVQLSPEIARVLQCCDGETAAGELAGRLAQDPSFETDDPEEVLELLASLAEQRIVRWTLEIPSIDLPAEDLLRAQLAQLPENDARHRAEAALAELVAARDAVANAAGDPVALDRALEQLEATFTRLTGADAARNAGQAYAGRTPLYEDCVRDLELRLGSASLSALAPLSLVLACARWYTHTIAERYRGAFAAALRTLGSSSGGEPIELIRFLAELAPELPSSRAAPPIVAAVAGELQSRWAQALDIGPEPRSITRRLDELAPRLQASSASCTSR